jgi:MoxR-like ATPase
MEDTPTANSIADTPEELQLVEQLVAAREQLLNEIGKVVFGQREVLDLMLIALLAKGHCLLHGVPGLGKTLMSNSLSKVLEMSFCRIQFTPDLMPSDITGTDVIDEDPETGRRRHEFLPGPIFANFVLADEINRTPPKTQAALLQAMQEREVSVGRKTYPLDPPFIVMATQNPIENEGTYVLPEAQLDRFMFCVYIRYPSLAEEKAIVVGTTGDTEATLETIMSGEDIIRLQKLVRGVAVSDDVVDYVVRLVAATRPESGDAAPEAVRKFVSCGASPRASQYLILGAKAKALTHGHYHVNFSDVKELAHPVLRHRLVMNFRSRADNVSADQVIDEILAAVKE